MLGSEHQNANNLSIVSVHWMFSLYFCFCIFTFLLYQWSKCDIFVRLTNAYTTSSFMCNQLYLLCKNKTNFNFNIHRSTIFHSLSSIFTIHNTPLLSVHPMNFLLHLQFVLLLIYNIFSFVEWEKRNLEWKIKNSFL